MKGLGVVFFLFFLSFSGARTINGIVFDRNVEGYLKRSADANTVALAKENLGVAVKYLEENDMVKGYTSILYRTPDEDVGFWFENLKASLQELRDIRSDATQLEKSNVLIKLRETLLDSGQSISVTHPQGISVFPNNMLYMAWGILSSLGTIVFTLIGWKDDF